jgi:hypothetical protein
MAKRPTAIAAYRPRIELGNAVQEAELSLYLSNRTGLNEGSVELVLKELRDAIIFFNRSGRPVRIEGLGSYTPDIDLDGSFVSLYRADTTLKDRLNARNFFSGTIQRRENVGKTVAELVAMWNRDHPDDPVM